MGEQVSEVAFGRMTLARVAGLLVGVDDQRRYRLIVDFVEAYRWEPTERRPGLLVDQPDPTGESRWDTFLAATARRLAEQDGAPVPGWAAARSLQNFWFAPQVSAPSPAGNQHASALFPRRPNSIEGPGGDFPPPQASA